MCKNLHIFNTFTRFILMKHIYIFYETTSGELILKRILQVVGEVRAGDLCGEIGVLCYRPQLFTVRTKRLCQLLRMNRTTFLNIVQANVGDGTIIMNNLLQV